MLNAGVSSTAAEGPAAPVGMSYMRQPRLKSDGISTATLQFFGPMYLASPKPRIGKKMNPRNVLVFAFERSMA